jgi:tetratricopeptide (TPR) repeat protein
MREVKGIGEDRMRGVITVIVLMAVVVLVYGNSFGNGFNYDDHPFILENPYVRDISNIPDFFTHPEMFSGRGTKVYRPLLVTTFALNYHAGGYEPYGYRIVNILLHVLNVLLVYGIALFFIREVKGEQSFRGTVLPAFLTALLFGVHTLNTQAVNWISSRSVLLVSFFYLGAFYCYMQWGGRSERQGAREGRHVTSRFWTRSANLVLPTSLFYFLSLILYTGALLTKAMAITLPLVLILYDYLMKKRQEERRVSLSFFGFFRRHILFWLISGGYLLIRKALLGKATIEVSGGTLIIEEIGASKDVFTHLLTQTKALFFYIKSYLLPFGLSIEHSVAEARGVMEWGVMGSLVVIVVVLGVAIYCVRSYPWVSFSLLWFFIVLLPETLVPLKIVINEHRAYLPGIGFALVVGFIVSSLMGGLRVRQVWVKVSVVCVVVFISANAMGTVKRNQVWNNDFTLWSDAIKKAPLESRPHYNLGTVLKNKEMFEEASQEYKRAIAISPTSFDAHNNLGIVYRELGLLEEAVREFKKVIKLNPAHKGVHNNLGLVYGELGRFEEAVSAFKVALNLNDDPEQLAGIHMNLGDLYRKKGVFDNAIKEYDMVLGMDSARAAVAHYNRGRIFIIKELFEEAAAEYREALKIDPEWIDARNNLGVILGRLGHFDEAINEFKTALMFEPSNNASQFNLGLAYIQKGDCNSAIKAFDPILKREPDNQTVLSLLEKCKREGMEKSS